MMDDILKIIKNNEFVVDIQMPTAVMIGTVRFRFFAELTFNIKKLNDLIMIEYSNSL